MWWAPPEDKPGILFPPNGFIYIFLPRCLPVSLSPRPRRTENGKKTKARKSRARLAPGRLSLLAGEWHAGPGPPVTPLLFSPSRWGRPRAGSFGGGKSVWGRGGVVGPHATHVSTGSCRRPGGSQAGSSADRRLAGTLCGWSVRAGG
jgi:hypothetical protein